MPELGLKVTSLLQFSCFFDDGRPEFGIGQAIGPLWDFCAPISIIVEL